MTDIGDRDQQAEAAVREPLGVHRVVEIARILAVDRHQRQRAQIDALRGLGRIDALAPLRGLAQRRRRELHRQAEARDRRLGGHVHRALRIEALLDARLGLARASCG